MSGGEHRMAYLSPVRSRTALSISSAPIHSSRTSRALEPRLSSDSVDFTLSHSIKFLATRSEEKAEMRQLNERLVSYIDKVHFLEQQKQALSGELQKLQAQGRPRMAELYHDQLRELHMQADQLSSQRAGLEVDQGIMGQDIQRLRHKLQEEILQKEETEHNLQSFRQDVDNASLVRLDLERKVESLQEQIRFLQKIHEEDVEELQAQIQEQHVHIEMGVNKPDLTTALRDVRLQYENLATKNLQESEDSYKSKFADLSEQQQRNSDAIRQAMQEASDYRRQVQTLTCEVDTLKGTNEAMERQMRDVEDGFGTEAARYQDTIGLLEEDICNMKEEMAHQLTEYQDLLNIKMALDIEIATYRKLLEGEESRIATPLPNFSSFNLRGHQ